MRTAATVPNTLPVIARWKILDNLRRSLMPPALVALLVAGWTFLPGSPAFWTTLALLVLAFPAYIQVGRSHRQPRARACRCANISAPRRDTIVTSVRQAAFSIIMLAHQSVVMLDAIGRALVRVLVTRRGLLEWVTADRAATTDASFAHAFCEDVAGAGARRGDRRAGVPWSRLARSCWPAPILILWFISPIVAYMTRDGR